MNSTQLLTVGTTLTGALIAGEALALLIGMHLLSGRGNPWISLRNDSLLAADIVTGSGLILIATLAGDALSSNTFHLLLLVSVLVHVYREWEVPAKVQNRFCVNTPLFVVNSLKLLGLLIVAALSVGIL